MPRVLPAFATAFAKAAGARIAHRRSRQLAFATLGLGVSYQEHPQILYLDKLDSDFAPVQEIRPNP